MKKNKKQNSSNRHLWLYCIECQTKVEARLSNGQEVYPHRKDLATLPFWVCDTCGNWVGCHHKTQNPTRPLGCIPNPEMKNARQHIHQLMDSIMATGKISRHQLYCRMSQQLNLQDYHTAELRTIEEARKAYRAAIIK